MGRLRILVLAHYVHSLMVCGSWHMPTRENRKTRLHFQPLLPLWGGTGGEFFYNPSILVIETFSKVRNACLNTIVCIAVVSGFLQYATGTKIIKKSTFRHKNSRLKPSPT